MKKPLLFLIFLFIANNGFAQIVNIPDPVFKQRIIDNGVDTNFDEEIQVAEAEAFTGHLDVNGQFDDIFDMTGIEAFVNITELSCGLNEISTLDLSQNTQLIYLDCVENPLTSLNINECSLLEILFAEDTQLPLLDLSNQINLIDLGVSDTALTRLDLSNNINLENISTSNNDYLVFLDIRNDNNTNIDVFGSRNCPNLTCIFIDDKDYMETNFGGNIDPQTHFVETQAECDALGVDKNSVEIFTFYPNPIKNILNVKMASQYDFQNTVLVITDVLGKTIFQSKIRFPNFEADLSGLEKGIYFLNVRDNRGLLSTEKIIKL